MWNTEGNMRNDKVIVLTDYSDCHGKTTKISGGSRKLSRTMAVILGVAVTIEIMIVGCDCHAENDAAIVPDVGFFASFDPVALDVACAEAVNKQPAIANTCLSEADHEGHDHFSAVFPSTNWRTSIEHAKKIGLGTDEYELVIVK